MSAGIPGNPPPSYLDLFLMAQFRQGAPVGTPVADLTPYNVPRAASINAVGGLLVSYDPVNQQVVLDASGVGGGGQTNLTLVNGLNSNIATGGLRTLRVGGPSAAFSIGGFTSGAAGSSILLTNTTSQPMTIVHEDLSSTAANRIDTQSNGVSIVLQPKTGSALFLYDNVEDRWIAHSIGVHRPETVNARDFGAKGDGSTDDTAALQAFLNAGTALHVPMLIPSGTYIVSSGLTLDTQSGPLNTFGFHLSGHIGSDPSSLGTELKYTGSVRGGPILIVKGGQGCTVEDIDFNANNLALQCVQVQPNNAFNQRWLRCIFQQPIAYPYWQASHTYAVNAIVCAVQANGVGADIGHYFQVQSTSSDAHSGATPPAWNTSSGGTTTDNHVTWVEIGFSAACFLNGTGSSVAIGQSVWRDCTFNGGGNNLNTLTGGSTCAGWRAIGGGNVKDFYLDNCNFELCGRSVDWAGASGTLQLNFPSFELSGETDVFIASGGQATIDSLSSEGSVALLTGGFGHSPGQVRISGAEWVGQALAFGTGFNFGEVIRFGGGLKLDTSFIQDNGGANTFPYIGVWSAGASGGGGNPGIFEMVNCWLYGATENRLFDSGFNDLLNTSNSGSPGQSYKFVDVFVYLRGNTGGTTGTVALIDVTGSQTRSSRQQLLQNKNNSEITAGVVILEQGFVPGAVHRFRIDHSLWTAAAHSQVIRIGGCFPPYTIKGVYAITTVAYAGAIPTSPQLSVERFSQATGSLLIAHDVHTAAVNKPAAITDLGADFQSAGTVTAPFGVVTSLGPAGAPASAQYPTVTEDFITVTMAAGGNLGNGSVTNFSAGSTDIIVEFEALPLG